MIAAVEYRHAGMLHNQLRHTAHTPQFGLLWKLGLIVFHSAYLLFPLWPSCEVQLYSGVVLVVQYML